MKHSLSLLCLAALSSLLPDHNATAQSLLEPNPTPIELNSTFVSESAYQVAGVYHIVDYSKKMESFYGKRINEEGGDAPNQECSAYGLYGTCTAPAVGKGVKHPIAGLTCYEKCVSCADSGYVDSCTSSMTGTKVTTADGLTCYKNCQCPSEYKYATVSGTGRTLCSSPATVGGRTCTQNNIKLYQSCSCPSEYNLTTKQANADCTSCTVGSTTKYKCVTNCDAYTLTVCPEGCNCSSCTDGSTKYKIDSAKTNLGWSASTDGKTCPMTNCPTGYSRGISCDSSSTKPNYHKHATAMSGGLECGYCSCDNTTDCSAYTLTSQSDANATYSSCNTGCGSAAKTTYKFESCKASYFDTENYWCSVPVTDCATLGYNKTTSYCSGKQIVKCPFDETKIACFENE